MKKLLFVALAGVLCLAMPVILWFFSNQKPLGITLIDKTVPDESFREHLGISWVLNYFKYVNNDGKAFEAASDYVGFEPNEQTRSYRIRSFPKSLAEADLIYLADTYGVYKEDVPWVNKKREGARSSLIYGGLQMEEWQTILQRLNEDKPTTFIAEFNSFASPTKEDVRKSMEDYLQLEWSGWIGRYFDELAPNKNNEIPQWIVARFGDNWHYSGAGYILINDTSGEVVVLEASKHFNGHGINMKFTEQGHEKFGLKKSADYQYWFDIVTPKARGTALAYYQWDLTDQGKEVLKDHHIPLKFAGVIETSHRQTSSYYFAGDFNDISQVPRFYQFKGYHWLKEIFSQNENEQFFWQTYVPMMKVLLEQSEHVKTKKESKLASKKSKETAYTSRVNHDTFEVRVGGQWRKLPIKGVNIGMGKPGVFPGEAAITEEEYYRWFQYIGEMGANSIRVYTLHPPGFYQALKRYNEEHKNPIYIFHGVWIEEESLVDTLDAFAGKHTDEFQSEMKRITDVVHGNAVVKPRAGHASGVYNADISPYVIGWIIGIEWYPQMVENTNDQHQGIGDYNGTYFQTNNGTPFEHWLAKQMDTLVTYEKDQYNWVRPVSFTNWVTTDILTHPSEPNEDEDLVSVNPNVIQVKNEMKKTNQFASYHVYPYYPDFFNYEEKYLNYVDHRGEKNSYAAYLRDLHQAHKLPILIAEFGVPASRGLTHANPFGRTQGLLSEKEQGEVVVDMYEDIQQEGLLGGLIFTWQDEWFKRTWNTMDYDNPNRRPFWSNAQTNEQQFGLLSFDRNKIKVDGETKDWRGTNPFYHNENSFYIDHDERYLYFRINKEAVQKGDPVILLNTLPGQGNYHTTMIKDLSFKDDVDFMIVLNDKNDSHVLVDSYYDFFTYQYGEKLNMLHPKPPLPSKNSGIFHPQKLALNKELLIPSTGEIIPFSDYETGKLRQGNGNPKSANYDSLADYYVNEKDGMIEVRIPWLLLNVKDPSQREIMGDLYKDGLTAGKKINGIQAGLIWIENGQVTDSLPKMTNNQLPTMNTYKWDTWNEPTYKERLKQSYYIIQEAFK
ncbi:hypothetical protein [Bacillus sp. REN10]|uniref:hypothetical protein n=1 Tax=Bacillus sp. REN10 TaxID=2782541 RepID=UPI00193BF206|nr:hypothetical protein [Bacillus sp. REN10]